MLSASCDRSVRVWERASGRCLTTARFHADYVESIGVARDANVAVSAGLDNQLYLWDLQDMRAPTRAFTDDGSCRAVRAPTVRACAGPNATCCRRRRRALHLVLRRRRRPGRARHRVRLVRQGTTGCLTGPVDVANDAVWRARQFVRVWDPRMGRLVMRLPGHTLNVRDVRLNASATAAVSGSSDHTVRRWDLGQQRCVDMHTPLVQDAVWTRRPVRLSASIWAGALICACRRAPQWPLMTPGAGCTPPGAASTSPASTWTGDRRRWWPPPPTASTSTA